MTSDTMKVDWAQPIEVYSDREWHPARIVRHDTGETRYPYCLSYGRYDAQWHAENGKSCCSGDYARNKPAAAVALEHAPKPPEKPATGPNGVLTGTERLGRLEALEGLVRRMATDDVGVHDAFAEARALCPEPEIDPDLIKAREIATEHSPSKTSYIEGDMDDALMVKVSLAGIKAGRELGK